MIYTYKYKTPKDFSDIIINSDGEYLTGLYFNNECNLKINNNFIRKLKIIKETCKWLDIYFSGQDPNFIPNYKLKNLSLFKEEIFNIIKDIKYGQIITYNEIAKIISTKRNIKKMSAQAVGRALGSNPICIIFPCHRVVGKNNNLVGYKGGLKNKVKLLELEGIDVKKYNYKKEF